MVSLRLRLHTREETPKVVYCLKATWPTLGRGIGAWPQNELWQTGDLGWRDDYFPARESKWTGHLVGKPTTRGWQKPYIQRVIQEHANLFAWSMAVSTQVFIAISWSYVKMPNHSPRGRERWAEEQVEALLAYRCTPQSTTQEIHFWLTYGIDTMLHVEVG